MPEINNQPNNQLPHQQKGRLVEVNNIMQKTHYWCSEPEGKNFHPQFKPELTPKEMLELGVFGGKYWNDVAKTDEYPKDWWKNAILSGLEKRANIKLNYYKAKASLSLSEWERKGWIHPDDPRGWCEWYFRYYMGRRHPDDERQIKRWLHAKRFMVQVTHREAKGLKSLGYRQTMLHWAYDARKIPIPDGIY